ncbi:hypothetical protein SprV_0100334200 [Sparganum proliferum]
MGRTLQWCPQPSLHLLDAAVARLSQVETKADLDLPQSPREAFRAVQKLSSRKDLGSDVIPAEIYKHTDPQLMDHLTTLFQEMWRQGEVRRISRTPQSYTTTSGNEAVKSATTTEASSAEHLRFLSINKHFSYVDFCTINYAVMLRVPPPKIKFHFRVHSSCGHPKSESALGKLSDFRRSDQESQLTMGGISCNEIY